MDIFDDEDFDFLEEDEDLGADSVHASPDERVRAAVANVTVGDADALECSVCFLALRPPIFQVFTTSIPICIHVRLLAFLEATEMEQWITACSAR